MMFSNLLCDHRGGTTSIEFVLAGRDWFCGASNIMFKIAACAVKPQVPVVAVGFCAFTRELSVSATVSHQAELS